MSPILVLSVLLQIACAVHVVRTGRPLYWISDRVFLRLSDRSIIDGSLHGLAALGRRTAGGLSRIQNGQLHLYALLVLVGIVFSLAWSWRHV